VRLASPGPVPLCCACLIDAAGRAA